MAGLLSPLQLQAAAGLFQNQGYSVNANLTATVDAYKSTPLLANLIAAIGNASVLPSSTQLLLQTFANTSCVAVALRAVCAQRVYPRLRICCYEHG